MDNLHNREPRITLSQADIDRLLEPNNITFVRIELRHMMDYAKIGLRRTIESEIVTTKARVEGDYREGNPNYDWDKFVATATESNWLKLYESQKLAIEWANDSWKDWSEIIENYWEGIVPRLGDNANDND